MLPKLKLVKFLDHKIAHEDLASAPVPIAMPNNHYHILLGKRYDSLDSELKIP